VIEPKENWRVIGGIALLTPAVLLVHGYHPLADDGAVYVTGIKKLASPGLYQSDAVFALSPTHLSVFAHVLAPLTRWVPLLGLLLVCQVASIFLFLLGSWLVATQLFSRRRARWGAVLLAACCFTLPVAGTSLSIMDPYVTARSFSTPLGLFALAAVLEENWAWAVFWLALAALLHPLMAVYSAIAMLTVALSQRRLWRPLFVFYGLGFLLCAAIFFATRHADQATASICPHNAELLKNKSVLLGEVRGESCGIPHLAKNERDAPNFLYAALDRTACAPFFKGKAHEVQGTHETPQEIGDVGHPAIGGGDGTKSVFFPRNKSDSGRGQMARVDYPILRKQREGWGTRQLVDGIESKDVFLLRNESDLLGEVRGERGGIPATQVMPDFALSCAALSRSYFFLSSWQWYEYPGLLLPLLLLGIAGTNKHAPWRIRTLAIAATVMGSCALLVALCFVHRSGSLLLARLQVLRGFQFVYIAGVLLAGGLLAKLRPRTITAVCLLIAGALFAGQRFAYPESNHVEWPGLAPRNRWQQAFLWIRSETPGNAIFALDNDYIESPGEDAQGFRASAERSAVPDWYKDGGIASNFPQAAIPWWQGIQATEHLNSATDEQRLDRLKPFGVTWIVLPAEASTGFPCPFINAQVRVCQVAVSHAKGAK
jgi:hypothetical protein